VRSGVGAATAPTAYSQLAEVVTNLPLLTREARRARGLSLRGAGRQIGIGFSTILRVEEGVSGLNSETIIAVLRWLDQTGEPSV
jgi:ribosome-binding protein aMBF1 (putative translation factor)